MGNDKFSDFNTEDNPYNFLNPLKLSLPDWKIHFHETHPSTQIMAKNAFHDGHKEKGLFLVRNQTNGRGRGDRMWVSSPFGKDITMTILFPLSQIDRNVTIVNLIGGISVVEVLNELTGKHFMSKWPNDIFYDDAKVGGILSELLLDNFGNAVAMGIGINVNSSKNDFNSDDFLYDINTVSEIHGSSLKIGDLMTRIAKQFETNLVYMKYQNFRVFETKWLKHCWRFEQEVRFREYGEGWESGIVGGITPEGYLQIVDKDGKLIKSLIEGDVSL